MSTPTVLGIPCPRSGLESDTPDWRYRLWFALYRTVRVIEHKVGRHQKQQHFSIAPRCDWCGHRSPEQKRIAADYRRRFDALTDQPSPPQQEPPPAADPTTG